MPEEKTFLKHFMESVNELPLWDEDVCGPFVVGIILNCAWFSLFFITWQDSQLDVCSGRCVRG